MTTEIKPSPRAQKLIDIIKARPKATIPETTVGGVKWRKPPDTIDLPGASTILTASEAAAAGIEIPGDWLLKMTPTEGGVTEPRVIIPGGQELSLEEAEERLRAPIERAVSAVFPEQDVATLLGSLITTPEMDDAQIRQAEFAQGQFINEIQTIGRTQETEVLLTTLFPEITPEELDTIFSYHKEVKTIGGVRKLVTITSDGAAYDLNGKFVGQYNPSTRKMLPEDETTRILRQGGVSESEIQKIIVQQKLDLDAEGWVMEFHKINPSVRKALTASMFSRSFAAGIGNLVEGGAGVAAWQGQEQFAQNANEIAKVLQSNRPIITEEWTPSLSTLMDGRFWATTVAEALPLTLALIPIGILAAYAGGAIGTATIGTWGATALAYLFGMAAPTFIESALEAGWSYNEATAEGFNPEAAGDVAQNVFLKNMGLVGGTNALEIFSAFLPKPLRTAERLVSKGAVRLTFRGGRIVGGILTEGGQEALQVWITKSALGEKFEWDDEAKMSFLIGGMMGGGFAVGAQSFTAIQERVQKNLPRDLNSIFETERTRLIGEGLSEEQASLRALDKVAESKGGVEFIEQTLEIIKREELAKQAKAGTQDEIEKAAFDHIIVKGEQQLAAIRGRVAEGAPLVEALEAERGPAAPEYKALQERSVELGRQIQKEGRPTQLEALRKERREVLIQMDLMQDAARATAKEGEIAPIPENPEVEGNRIAEATGLRYDGVQEGIGMQFTDTEGTGTTFYANTLEEAKAKLAEKRKQWAETPSAKPVKKPRQKKAKAAQTYEQAVKAIGDADTNMLVTGEAVAIASNAGRVLMVQFSSRLGGVAEDAQAQEYYDTLYSEVPGYARPADFWEIPQWVSTVAHSIPNADMYVVRNVEEAKAYVATSGHKTVLFSSMDVNVDFIREVAQSFPGDVIVSGYANPAAFEDIKNIKFKQTMKEAADELGIDFELGVDFRHFQESESVPRICMSKGCKHKCAFCVVPKGVTVAPVAEVSQQVEAMKNIKVPLAYIDDKTFGQAENYRYLTEIRKQIEADHPEFQGFIIQTTAPQFLQLTDAFIRASGIKYVELGVETFNNKLLRALHKPSTEQSIQKAADKMRQVGVKFVPNILIGTTARTTSGEIIQETTETYQRTLDFLRKNRGIISHLNIYNLSVYEGTELKDIVGVTTKQDINENIVEKSFHQNPEVHAEFAREIYALGVEFASGKVTLTHFGKAGLTEISPEQMGTGQAGSEARFFQEYQSHFKKGWFVRRSYFYLPGQGIEPRFQNLPRYDIDVKLNIFNAEKATEAELNRFRAKREELLVKFREEFGELFGNLAQQGAEVNYATAKALGYDAFATDRGVAAFKAIPIGEQVAPAESALEGLPDYKGRAYRSETGFQPRGSVADVVRYERDELGNPVAVSAEQVKELEQYRASDVGWVTKTKKDAARYGDPELLSGAYSGKILAEDGDGGYLVFTGEIQPLIRQPAAEAAQVKREEAELPTAANKLRETQKQVEIDVLSIQASIKGEKGLKSRQTNLVLKGTQASLREAAALIDRMEAGEEVTAQQLNEVRERLQVQRQMYRSKNETLEDVRKTLTTYASTLPVAVRGKLLASVKNVRTETGMDKAIALADRLTEEHNQRVLRAEITKEMKSARVVKKQKLIRGKFTPEIQNKLEIIRHNLELNRDDARGQMLLNMEKFQDGEISEDEMLEANEALNYAGIKGMSSEELAATLAYIKTIKKDGKTARQAKREAYKEKMDATRTELSGVVTGGKGLKEGTGTVPRAELEETKNWLETVVNWQYSWDNFLDKLSKFHRVSQPYQSPLSKFGQRIHQARDAENVGRLDAQGKITQAISEIYGVTKTRDLSNLLNTMQQERINLGTFVNMEGETVTLSLTKDQIIKKYMELQDPSTEATFAEGMKWTDEIIDAVKGAMTTQDIAFAEWQLQFYRDYYPAVSAIYGDIFGVDLGYNPYYSPFDRDVDSPRYESVLAFEDFGRYASTLNNSLKSRINSKKPLRFTGALDTLQRHVLQMEHFKAWSYTIRDLRAVFGNTEMRTAIRQYHGAEILRLVDTYINGMARGGADAHAIGRGFENILNRAADTLRRNFTRSILGLKLSIGLKQVPSILAYMTEMPLTDFASGVAAFWENPIANYRTLLATSPYLQERFGAGFEQNIHFAMQRPWVKTLSGQGNALDWTMGLIRAGDKLAVVQGMWAKYQSGLKVGLTSEEALLEAESTTRRTQPTFEFETLSPIQNGGPLVKLLVMFHNQPDKYFRVIGDNMRNFKYGRGSRPKALFNIALTWAALPMLFQFIADAFQFKEEKQARAFVLGPINYMLIFGQIAQAVYGWVLKEPFDYQASPVFQSADDLRNGIAKLMKLYEQGTNPYKDVSVDDTIAAIEFFAKAAGQVTGVPTPYLVQAEKGVRSAVVEEDPAKLIELVFSRWSLEPPKKDTTGKISDLFGTLGQSREETVARPLTGKPAELIDMEDMDREMAKVYAKNLPSQILADKNSSVEAKAWAEKEQARGEADILPNLSLYKINTDPGDDTIVEYYRQWQARQRLATLAQINEFDSLYPNAKNGNVSRTQYSLLVQYLETPDDKKQAFLDSHPELRINPRDEWLKSHPVENARLALWGDAKIMSTKAYQEFKNLMSQLDIPEDGLPPMTLPPEGSVENYFNYITIGSDRGWNSWEAQLLIAKDDALRIFLERQPVETPVAALELKIKNRPLYDLIDSYSDPEALTYVADTEARAKAIEKLKTDNPKWVDDMRKIEAIEKDADSKTITAWVGRGKTIDKFGAGSSEAKVWLLDNPEVHSWALEQKLLAADGSDWNEEVLRLNVKWAKQDEDYAALKTTEERAAYLQRNELYRIARRERDAYSLDFEPDMVKKYVDYYELPGKGFEKEHYLLDHPELESLLTDPAIMGKSALTPIDPAKVPGKRYDEIYRQFQKQFDEWDAYSDPTSEKYLVDPDARQEARDKMLARSPEFQEARYRRDAYKLFIGREAQVEPLVGYRLLLDKGKPEGQQYWFDDDWYLMDHPELYRAMVDLGQWQEKDFTRVPPKDVFEMYMVYDNIIGDDEASQSKNKLYYRRTHPRLDAWLVLIGAVSKTVPELDAEGEKTSMEKKAEASYAMRNEVDKLKAEIDRKLRALQP